MPREDYKSITVKKEIFEKAREKSDNYKVSISRFVENLILNCPEAPK